MIITCRITSYFIRRIRQSLSLLLIAMITLALLYLMISKCQVWTMFSRGIHIDLLQPSSWDSNGPLRNPSSSISAKLRLCYRNQNIYLYYISYIIIVFIPSKPCREISFNSLVNSFFLASDAKGNLNLFSRCGRLLGLSFPSSSGWHDAVSIDHQVCRRLEASSRSASLF